jgi:hypothetical protein
MKWIKPDPVRQYYELTEGGDILASLEWMKPGNADAVGIIGDRRLSLIRKGFFFHHIVIVDKATGSELASFKFSMDKGELTLGDGGAFLWKFEGLKGSRWYFTTNRDSELLCFTVPEGRNRALSREVANVEVLRSIDENVLLLLAVVGWYNIHGILSSGL